jgi:hypothetical protein
MAGLLTHFGAGLLGALIIFFIFYKSEKKTKLIYGVFFIFANILPDFIDFGILSVKMGSLNPDEIMTHKLFHTLAVLGHTFSNWIIVGLVIIVIIMIFSFLKKISWKGFMKWVVGVILVLIGIRIHLLLDVLIQESSHWI